MSEGKGRGGGGGGGGGGERSSECMTVTHESDLAESAGFVRSLVFFV